MRVSSMLCSLGLVVSFAACKKEKPTEDPDSASSNLLGPTARSEDPEDLVGGGDDDDSDLGLDDDDNGMADDAPADDGKVAKGPKLPPKSAPVQKCTGKGKKRTCKEVDPKPEVSASHGVVALMGEYRFGQSFPDVFKLVTRGIEKEYETRQAKAKDPLAQDGNHKWHQEQLRQAKENHVKFVKNANHRWGVSLIQYDYEDDANEEMIWTKNDGGLRKFYFFKDGELWKVVYAYSTDNFPGKTYEQVVDEKFKKWFGMSPDAKVKQDPKTKAPIVRYNEWTAMNGEQVRSFDMTAVNGVIMLAVVDGNAEKRIGERLPNVGSDDSMTDVVGDVLGGSDVCYDKSGNIAECSGPQP